MEKKMVYEMEIAMYRVIQGLYELLPKFLKKSYIGDDRGEHYRGW